MLAWATLFLFLLTVWMIVEIVAVRIRAASALRRERMLEQVWETCFFAAALGDESPPPPRLARRDRIRVLKIWCRIGDQVVGESRERLAALGLAIGLDDVAGRILSPPLVVIRMPSSVELLLAIRAAERMRLDRHWQRLAGLVAAGPAPLDRVAARALVALDAWRAAHAVIPALIRQGRWARHLVEDLVEAGAADALDAYATLLGTVAEDVIPGLALLIDRCNDARAAPAVRARLGDPATRDADAVAALLNSLGEIGDASDQRLVRAFIAHDSWVVRMRAAQALGQCGDRGDAAALEVLLGDSNWYTRYHAARAILRLADLGATHLENLADSASDRFSRDMARHVLAESATPAVR